MDVLHCKSQHIVDKEIAVYFLAYNLGKNQWGQTRLISALEMDVLRCKSQHMVDKEIAVYFLAYNLVRWAGCGSLAHGGIASGVEF